MAAALLLLLPSQASPQQVVFVVADVRRRRHHRRRLEESSSAQRHRSSKHNSQQQEQQPWKRVWEMAEEWKSRALIHSEQVADTIASKPWATRIGALSSLLLLLAAAAAAIVAHGRRRQTPIVVRRDRSLGGKEVVVATQQQAPLSDAHSIRSSTKRMVRGGYKSGSRSKELPSWWMQQHAGRTSSSSSELPGRSSPSSSEAQAQADLLVQMISEKRIRGIDFNEEDILMVRSLCRASGASAKFHTENARDNFFRAAVSYVLGACSRQRPPTSSFSYGGEDAAAFLPGLAANIQLPAPKAASMVTAAVASRTRAGFLQAWAFMAQGKEGEASEELLCLVCMHTAFPSSPRSPEMEMVARGLERHLKCSERQALLQMYKRYGPATEAIAEEALFLDSFSELS